MHVKYRWFILILVCLLNFASNNQYLKPDIMEARNLITAREMAEKGNWLNPTMNGYPRLAKPPLPTWINGVIAKVSPVDNLSIHRIPAVIMGLAMVLAIFFIAKNLSVNERTAYYSALVAGTSYYLILMSRQATWDIYCHSFMAIAVAFLVVQWKNKPKGMMNYLSAGLFMGLSFMSKGPVSFYVILIPFMISWIIIIKNIPLKEEWKGLVAMMLIFILVGLAWPIYQLLANKELLLKVVNAESQAWTERHAKPFYQYWGFWSHAGIWSVFALATLVYPFMKKRLPITEYKFFFLWLIIMVVLLSIPAEKKERYLLPVLIPLSCLVGYYLSYLNTQWQEKKLDKADKILIRIFVLLLSLISLVAPIYLYYTSGLTVFSFFVCMIFWCIGIGMIFILKLLNIRYMLTGAVLLMTLVTIVGIPMLEPITNAKYTDVKSIRKKDYYDNAFYSTYLNPKIILDIGKEVDTLRYANGHFILPERADLMIVDYNRLIKNQMSPRPSLFQLVDSIYFETDNEEAKLFVFQVAQ